MSMSIGTFLTTVGGIIAGPIGTGIGNIAAVSNLGVSIATKIDTSKIRSDVGGIRTDIRSLDRDIASLACDIDDMRSENAWNVATTDRCPISVNRGEASYNTQLIQTNTPQTNTNAPQTNTNAPQQQDDSSDEKLNQIANMLGAIIQQNQSQQVQPVQQAQAAPTPQYITKDELNGVLNNLVGSIPTLVGQAVQQALTPPPTATVVNPTPTPDPAPEAPDTE